MKKVNVMLVIGTVILAVALAGCTGDSTPTSTSTATSKSTYSSSSSSKSSTSTKSDYHSGKGSEWDKQVNDIADEYGDDMGLSAEEIDAMMRAMEKRTRLTETALTPKREVSAVSFALDVNLEYTLSLRRQKSQKRKNRVGFQIILQNVNKVQTMGLLLWYNNSRKRRENVKMKIAYVRVSTVEQNEARQIEALKKYDVDKWFTEKVSAKDTNRPQLQAMIDFAREGDTIYIHDFSRLARSTADLLKLVEQLQAKGVHLVSNKENINTSTPTGRLMLTMIGAINEFERCNLLERQREGIAIAKAQGKFKGRKEVKADDFAAQYQRYLNRELNKAQLAKTLGISRPTLDKLIRQHTTA